MNKNRRQVIQKEIIENDSFIVNIDASDVALLEEAGDEIEHVSVVFNPRTKAGMLKAAVDAFMADKGCDDVPACIAMLKINSPASMNVADATCLNDAFNSLPKKIDIKWALAVSADVPQDKISAHIFFAVKK